MSTLSGEGATYIEPRLLPGAGATAPANQPDPAILLAIGLKYKVAPILAGASILC